MARTKKKHKKSVKKSRKRIKKYRKTNYTNRVQIGCSNKKNKVMTGGGINALSQPFENAYYAITGGISNSYDNFLGNEHAPSSSISVQPYPQ